MHGWADAAPMAVVLLTLVGGLVHFDRRLTRVETMLHLLVDVLRPFRPGNNPKGESGAKPDGGSVRRQNGAS